MTAEPMYNADMTIRQYGWFCQVDGCEGYGGPVRRTPAKKKAKPLEQLNFLGE